jgi:hypothetical protein
MNGQNPWARGGPQKNSQDTSKIEESLASLVGEFYRNKYTPISLAQLGRSYIKGNKHVHNDPDSLQESLDYLRVCIKYQLFDLEATRRENKYLRKLLEERR